MTDAKKQISRASRMAALIEAELDPARVVIEDQSARHAGHGGARPEGETHFHISIVASAFEGQTRLARHRAVTALLAGEFATGLHALSLDLKTPREAGAD